MEIKPSSDAAKEYIHSQLQRYNANYMTEFRDYSFHMEESETIIAGIVAESVGDTVEVEFLYVDEAFRGRGLGARLLRRVEEEAKKDGMSRILLNTYSFQAPGFYEKMTYRKLFEISPCFGAQRQFYFIKELI